MNITFGIITDGKSDANILRIIESINNLQIPFYEIIIIGNSRIKSISVKIIPFDENQKKGWLTKKRI